MRGTRPARVAEFDKWSLTEAILECQRVRELLDAGAEVSDLERERYDYWMRLWDWERWLELHRTESPRETDAQGVQIVPPAALTGARGAHRGTTRAPRFRRRSTSSRASARDPDLGDEPPRRLEGRV